MQPFHSNICKGQNCFTVKNTNSTTHKTVLNYQDVSRTGLPKYLRISVRKKRTLTPIMKAQGDEFRKDRRELCKVFEEAEDEQINMTLTVRYSFPDKIDLKQAFQEVCFFLTIKVLIVYSHKSSSRCKFKEL